MSIAGPKRYIVVAAAILMQMCLGGIYAWSAFVPRLRSDYGFSSTQTQMVFGTCVCVFSFTVFLAGRMYRRLGPRRLSIASGLFTLAAYLAAWRWGGSFWMLWLAIGCVGGLGIALGYVCPIATAVQWFPNNKGLVCGLAVAGYGGGAIMLSRIVEAMLSRGWAVLDIFGIVGSIFGPMIMLMGAMMFVPSHPHSHHQHAPMPRYSAVLSDRRFWMLFLGMFCGTAPGLTVIGNIKPMAELSGNTAFVAAATVGVLAFGNAAGRILWGLLHDVLGGRRTILLSLAAMGAAILGVLASGSSGWSFLICATCVGFCYGACFAIYPAQVAHVYGSDLVGMIYAMVLFAQGVSALIGPAISGLSRDFSGGFTPALLAATAIAWAGVVIHALLSRGSAARVNALGGPGEQTKAEMPGEVEEQFAPEDE